MSKRYVPDKTFLVCSDGMSMQQLKVNSQTSIKIVGGKLAATEEDRTGGNFMCAKMVVAGAIVGAITAGVIAAATVTTGGLALGAIAAAGAAGGAVAGLGLGIIPCVCSLLTMPNDWTPVHPKVKFENKRALMESSMISCLLGGQVMIFYSQEAAQEAVDLRQKKTLANVGLVAASAFIAGAAFQGIVAGCRVLSHFGWRAFSNYLGGVAYSGGAAFIVGLGVDKGKNMIYEGLGIKDEIDGYNTDIVDYPFESIDSAVVQKNQPIEDEEEDDIEYKVEEVVKAGGETSKEYYKNTVSNNMTVEKSNFARLDDIEEHGVTTYRELGVDPNAIQGKKPKFSETISSVENEDFGGKYQDGYTSRTMYNQQYKMLDNSVRGGAKQAFQGAKSSIFDGKGFLLGLLLDLYKFIVNPFIADELQDYIEAMQNEEAQARAGINVKTQKY